MVAIKDLNERSREIFRGIVDTYLETGEPVGSRFLSRHLGVDLSPASIRNIMSDLEAAGLLFSPHTSAGRLPTDAGLRMFVDGLLQVGVLSDDEQRQIERPLALDGQNDADPDCLHDGIGALIEHIAQETGARHLENCHVEKQRRNDRDGQQHPGWADAIVMGEADDAAGQREQENGKNTEADEAMVGLKRQDEFKHDIEDAQTIGEGEPTRAQRRTLIGSDDTEGGGKDTCDKQVDGQHKSGCAHGHSTRIRTGPILVARVERKVNDR